MDKAAIRKQGDRPVRWHYRTYLIEHSLVVFKTDLCPFMAQGSPGERNGPTTIHEGGTNQNKGREGSRIQGYIQATIEGPIDESDLQEGQIPLRWRDSGMM